MRIVFAGTPANSAKILNDLIKEKIEIVGVLTRLDAKMGRKGVLQPSPVASAAQLHNLNVYKANRIDENVNDWLIKLNPDLGLIVAFGSILAEPTLSIPRLGWLNLHYSLLPQLPGPAPVQHALLSGLSETGVTLFRLDEGIDTGPVVGQESLSIDEIDDSTSLLKRLTDTGSRLLVESIRDESKISSALPQAKGASFNTAIKPTRAMAQLNFTDSAETNWRKIRAFNPEPMAWFSLENQSIRVLRASIRPNAEIEMGECALIGSECLIGCAVGGALFLEQVQPAGKRPMSGSDWFRGLHRDKIDLL